MKILCFILALGLAAPDSRVQLFREATDLYEHGMYAGARELFENLGDDPLAKAYAVMCALRMDSPDCGTLVEDYVANSPSTVLDAGIYYGYAANRFEAQDYASAAIYLDKADTSLLDPGIRSEYLFRRGFCHLGAGDTDAAADCFSGVLDNGVNPYASSSAFLLGMRAYGKAEVEAALPYFEKAAVDPRLESISRFYIIECRFLRKEYSYVISEGEKMFRDCPEVRRQRLSRMMSEAYLVGGDFEKARFYLSSESREDMTRSDYFHAGSVLYASGDFDGAVANFTRMTDRSDSLGQIADYQLGYSYIRKMNKVKALDAFRNAASLDFDPKLREDAFFNYAKLEFDINRNVNGFKSYLNRYSTKVKGEQIYNYIALANLVNHDYQGAIEAYDSMEELSDTQMSNYVKANFLKAYGLISVGSWTDAIPYLQAAGFHFPRSDRFNQLSRYWLAETWFKLGNFEKSREIMTDLYNISAFYGMPESCYIPYNVGCCNYELGNWDAAVRWFDISIANADTLCSRDASFKRADCFFMKKDYETAAREYGALSQMCGGDDLYPIYRQGLSYGLCGELKKKAAALEVAGTVPPGVPYRDECLYELGRARLDLKDYPSSLEAFKLLRNTSRDSVYVSLALIGLGMTNVNARNYTKALEYYAGAVDVLPGSTQSRNALMAMESIYNTIGQPDKYVEFVESRRLTDGKTEEEKARMYFNAAEQTYLSRNYQSAIKQLTSFVDRYPSSPDIPSSLFYLADSYNATGNREKALEFYSKVVSAGADSSYVESSRVGIATLNYSIERYGDAYAAYSDLLENAVMEANRELARTGMMRSAYRSKMYDKAVEAADSLSGTEAVYIKAKSLVALSRRAEAMELFRELSSDPSTPEGAESAYMLIQDALDSGDFTRVQDLTQKFTKNYGTQTYWLARAFIALGDSYAATQNTVQARATYESILKGYKPADDSDDIADNVELRLSRLKE